MTPDPTPATAEIRVPRCANCGGEIMRSDLTMQGPRGPWIHEATRTRMCRGEFTTPRFAEPIVGPAVSESAAAAAAWETECSVREDRQHCNHWYDDAPCCACGDDTKEAESA